MSPDQNPRKPRQHRDHDEPGSSSPGATGTLRIRVFASKKHDGRQMVRRAKVTLVNQGHKGDAPITGRTNESGELVIEVPAGQWQITATAFGLTDTSSAEEGEVKPNCETCVDLTLDVNLYVKLTPVDVAEGNEPTFHRAGTLINARAEPAGVREPDLANVAFEWNLTAGSILEDRRAAGREIHNDTSTARGTLDVSVTIIGDDARVSSRGTSLMIVPAPAVPVTGGFNVGLRRSASVVTPDLPLWVVIRNSTDGLSFKNYQRYIDMVLCDTEPVGLADAAARTQLSRRHHYETLKQRRFLPFCDSDAYRLLKVATEAFVMVNCGVALNPRQTFDPEDLDVLIGKTGVDNLSMSRFEGLWERYLEQVNGTSLLTLPYLAMIASKFPDARVKSRALASFNDAEVPDLCYGLLGQKLSEPCLVELIWSYWHEEAMLVQSINAISMRFQNRRAHDEDPLANMELSPPRPLNNLLWGYIQDEQHRLSVMRRAYEYDHEYGLRLVGRAARRYRTADSRVNFLRAFHNLLHLAADFFQKDDNTTVMADAFPVLNALKEVHLILSQGAHNQFGDLPVTARVEMLMQQWILARPEFADFLPTRAMVAYPEPWMDRVDAMKRVQGWSDVNVLHFRDLAVFGEKLLLTVRYGSWVDVNDPDQAKNWLRAWRPEIQGYIHAYRAVTGADVTAEVNTALPSALLQQRAAQQMRSRSYLGSPGY